MHFILYLLAMLSNIVVVFFLPKATAVDFLKAYSICAMVVGMLVVFAFSSPAWLAWLSRTRVVLFGGLIGLAIFGFAAQQVSWLAMSYAGSLLLSDYLVSQGGNRRLINIYRFMLVGSVVPAIMGIPGYDDMVVPLRIVACLALGLVSGKTGQGFQRLTLQSPILYIAGTHISYFGSLAAIAWLGVASEEVKAWYIGSQVGHSVLLKLYDYRIRAKASSIQQLMMPAYVVAVTVGFAVYLFVPQQGALTAYLMGILGLAVTFRISRAL